MKLTLLDKANGLAPVKVAISELVKLLWESSETHIAAVSMNTDDVYILSTYHDKVKAAYDAKTGEVIIKPADIPMIQASAFRLDACYGSDCYDGCGCYCMLARGFQAEDPRQRARRDLSVHPRCGCRAASE